MSIKFKNVTIEIDAVKALKNINFEIEKGESWVILGETGSGKTTFLNAVSGNEFPAKGHIEIPEDWIIEKVESNFEGSRLVHQAYQYYQQRYNADDTDITPTVYEVLQNQVKPLYTIESASFSLPSKLYDDSFIEEHADLLKIKHLLNHKIVTLSNGETRRVHILNALLKKPDVLLLDNPFVGLDIENRKILHSIIAEIQALGISVILVCPQNEIPENITNIVVLKQGKIDKIRKNDILTATGLRGGIENLKREAIETASLLDPKLLQKIKKKPKASSFKYAVRFRNVSVQYDGIKVIDGINWEIKKGDKWALLGPNGSGKSTILSLITADNPQGYRNDYDLFDKKRGSGESIWDIKKRIGYVSPELQLYANAYNEVWTVIASGLFDAAELYQPLTVGENRKVNNYIRLFGLQKVKNKLLHQLSSGQQRLVFLARALVKNPPLLILDEPCQGLDYAHMVQFRELVNELAVSLNKTLIYVTHYPEEIPDCVDQIFRINNGHRLGDY